MSPSATSTATKVWRWLFIALELIVLIPILATPFISRAVEKQLDGLPIACQIPLISLYLGAFLFLLIASPFFLRSLRWVALLGWIIAFGSLLCAALFPRL